MGRPVASIQLSK